MASGFTPEDFTKARQHKLLRILDHDSHAWLAQSAAGAYRAIQVVERRAFEDRRPYDREHKQVQDFAPISRTHENLVHILELGHSDEAEYFYYVMELADDLRNGQQIDPVSYRPRTLRSTLASHPRPDLAECLNVGIALTSALCHLHEHGLIHRDITPSRILFVNAKPKLGGLCVPRKNDLFQRGAPGYIAPEAESTPQADIYSLGKVIYELMTGQDRNAFPTLPENWAEDIRDRSKFLKLNEIILKACDHEPRKRYQSAEEMHDDLLRLS